ncbi:MAG: tryptophan-rich sensory protein [Phormidesmis sp.]
MQKSTAQIGRQWLTVVAVLIAIAINGLSNVYPPAGKNTGEVSNTLLNGVLITPAGYAFAIWGLIYIGLIAYGIYQVLPAQRHDPILAKVSWGIIGACAFQIIWLAVFLTFHFWWSVLFMLGILVCLAFAYVQTRLARPTRKVRWLLQAPISVYFGWITVAAVVNVAGALLVSFVGPGGTSLSTLSAGSTLVMMGISAAIAALIAIKYNDATYPAVSVWALSAIAVRQAGIGAIAFMGIGLSIGLCVVIVRVISLRRAPS